MPPDQTVKRFKRGEKAFVVWMQKMILEAVVIADQDDPYIVSFGGTNPFPEYAYSHQMFAAKDEAVAWLDGYLKGQMKFAKANIASAEARIASAQALIDAWTKHLEELTNGDPVG